MIFHLMKSHYIISHFIKMTKTLKSTWCPIMRYSSLFYLLTNIRLVLKELDKDKHSNLFCLVVRKKKKFFNNAIWSQFWRSFTHHFFSKLLRFYTVNIYTLSSEMVHLTKRKKIVPKCLVLISGNFCLNISEIIQSFF